MKKASLLIFFSLLFLFIFSCKRIETLPAIPSIEYQSFQIFDTTDILGNEAKGGRLNFAFEDGDGDLGLEPPQPEEIADTNNLIMTLFRKVNGSMVQVHDTVDDPLKPSTYRIPYMEREGQNKILRGVISVTFLYLFYTPQDTVSYEFYIRDRANNESNRAMTGEIIVSVNDTY